MTWEVFSSSSRGNTERLQPRASPRRWGPAEAGLSCAFNLTVSDKGQASEEERVLPLNLPPPVWQRSLQRANTRHRA